MLRQASTCFTAGVAVAFGVLSCAHAAPPASGVAAPAPVAAAASPPGGEAAIFYATGLITLSGAGPGVPLPCPLVRGTVAGVPTAVLVDTGAGVSVIASALASQAHLPLAEPFTARDSAGRPVPMTRSDRPALTLEGWGAVPDTPTGIADLPSPFAKLGIGAIVSPQALATEREAVVLDLREGKMRRVAVASIASRRPPAAADESALPGTRLCRYEWEAVRGRSLVARVNVDGEDVLLELDTGSNGISVGLDCALGKRLATRAVAQRSRGLGAAGEYEALRVDAVPVRLGALASAVTVNLVASAANAACGSVGRFGMDYLKSCVLVMGPQSLEVSCRLPPISTLRPACDACMLERCQEPAAVCQKQPSRCNDFSVCAGTCSARPCVETCGAAHPEGMKLNRCLNDRCADACGP